MSRSKDSLKVMVNGTFDIELLNFAKNQGHQLLVAIDTDRRVKELKGESRPINNQEDRKMFLYNLKAVDIVMLFDSKEELINIMKEYQPDIYVKGSDWKSDRPSTAEQFCEKVIYYDRVGDYSTTNIIQRIVDR
jgi:D-glycero-beta-D-manno-heptose 1-phosphate adenylyltransferase